MVKYCSECGAKLDDNAQFCGNCGKSQVEKQNKNELIIIGLIAIIAILSIILAMGFESGTELIIVSDSTITNTDLFGVKLISGNTPLSNEAIHITFNGNGKSYDYDSTTDSNGIAEIKPGLNDGEYEVTCEFKGKDGYSKSSTTKSITIEPDYMSYTFNPTFEYTDKNNDGYVVLNDMNMPHTPKDAQNRIFSDSDDDHDGKLNKYEYHKFMYKLNYDRPSYGLNDVKVPI